MDRPILKQMETAIKAGEIDVVIVSSIDRISRNFFQAEGWQSRMEKHGMKLIAMDGSHECFSYVRVCRADEELL